VRDLEVLSLALDITAEAVQCLEVPGNLRGHIPHLLDRAPGRLPLSLPVCANGLRTAHEGPAGRDNTVTLDKIDVA